MSNFHGKKKPQNKIKIESDEEKKSETYERKYANGINKQTDNGKM